MKNVGIIIGDITRSAGTERAVTNLSNLLIKYGSYNVTIISVNSKYGTKCYYQLDFKVQIEHLELKSLKLPKGIVSYFYLVKKCNSIIKTKKFDFILGTTHAINSLMIFLKGGVKKIACEHMNYNACPRFSSRIRKICYPKLDAVVLLTKADAAHYGFIRDKKIFVIPNSLSFTVERPAELDNKRIIAVGRLTKQKGFDLLIHAAVEIRKQLPDWKIDIFGDGEDKEKLLKMISDYGLSDYIFINNPTPNIQQELLKSSLCVITSRWEGFSMILIEAKACGLPVVSFDCPDGPAEIIENAQDGYLINRGDEIEFISKVVKICKNYKLRLKLGNKAKENSSNFSPSIIFNKWEYLFKSL